MNALKSVFIAAVILASHPLHSLAQESREFDPTTQILDILTKYNVPGAAVALVSKDSIIWMGALGKADVKNNIPVTTNTLFTIGSLSKPFAGAAALIAQEQGLLDITTPIKETVPSLEFGNQWEATDPVRLIHLLEHTSGFDESHFHLVARANAATPFAEIMKLSRSSLNTRWRPGNYFEYNTLGYVVVAHVIEESVGAPFQEFVRTNLLLPLEMPQATYHPSETTSNFSRGYEGSEFREVPFPSLPVWPAGTLTTSIAGMCNFTMMLLNNGQFKNQQVMAPTSVARMEKPETSIRAKAGIRLGYGKGLQGEFENGHPFYGHGGQAGGFSARFGYSRELSIGYVILLNHRDGNRALKAIKKSLLAGIMAAGEAAPEPALSETKIDDVKKLTGGYQRITGLGQLGKISRFIVRLADLQFVDAENGQLVQSSVVGDKQDLHRVRDLLFRRAGEPIATSAFVPSQDGTMQWLDEAAYQRIPAWWGYFQFYTAVACILIILLAFITLLFSLPIRLIRKRPVMPQALPFFAICCFLGMLISFITLFDPEKLYSAGAILFFVLGWGFFILSFWSLARIIMTMYRKTEIRARAKYQSLLTSAACCITAFYLLYWDIIGLALWGY